MKNKTASNSVDLLESYLIYSFFSSSCRHYIAITYTLFFLPKKATASSNPNCKKINGKDIIGSIIELIFVYNAQHTIGSQAKVTGVFLGAKNLVKRSVSMKRV